MITALGFCSAWSCVWVAPVAVQYKMNNFSVCWLLINLANHTLFIYSSLLRISWAGTGGLAGGLFCIYIERQIAKYVIHCPANQHLQNFTGSQIIVAFGWPWSSSLLGQLIPASFIKIRVENSRNSLSICTMEARQFLGLSICILN